MSGRRLALVITVDRYDDPGLGELVAPAADAQALADVLGDPDLGGFELEFLHNPTSWTTNERVDGLLSDRQPEDLVLLHFSCHGLKDVDGELYLATTNTVPERLPSTAVESAWINRVMQRTRAQRVVLLLDCCYGGAFERGVLVRAAGNIDVGDQFRPDHLSDSRGRVVITASTAMEYAFEGSQISDSVHAGPSVFTSALVEGIRTGKADRDLDGFVGLDELYDYVYDQVRYHSPQQTPCKWEFGLRGELYVARNPNRRVAPADLPQELLELIEHTSPGARLAAVHELTGLAEGPNLARAAAARLTLGRLVDDDSRRVATSAVEALRDTAVHLPESTISLDGGHGEAPRSSAEVPVEGPPLALASTVVTSGAGLRARIESGTLRISWSAGTGRLDGTVTLSGPAGEAWLRVTAGLGDDRPPPAIPPTGRAGTDPSAQERAGLLLRGVPAVLRPRARRVMALLIAVPVIAFGVSVAVSHDDEGGGPVTSIAAEAYVPSMTDRLLASMATPVVVATIPVGRQPGGVAVSPDSRTVYVANQDSGTLSMIDAATRKVRTSVQFAYKPRFAAVSPDGARVYVSMYADDLSGSAVAAIDAVTGRQLGVVATGPRPFALATGRDNRIWVPIHDGTQVEIIDGLRIAAVGAVSVPQNPHAVALSADGSRAFTPDHASNMVSIIDTRKRIVIANIPVGRSPHSLAIAPDGRTVVVALYDAAAVDLIDVPTRHVSGPFPVGEYPQSVAFASDGAHAYVINEGGDSLSTLTVPAGRVTSTLPLGQSPRMIAVAPDGRFAYVTNGAANTVTVIKVAG
jgi:YVTN family beta-propeller protein